MALLQRKGVEEGGDGRWVNPDRDIGHCWPSLCKALFDGLEEGNWQDWFKGYFAFAGVTPADLDQVAQAYALFFRHAYDPQVKTPEEALRRAGWFETKPAAQVAVMMKLGQVMTCAFFPAVRDLTFNNAPPFDANAILAAARGAHRSTLPPSRRGGWWGRLKGLLWKSNRGGSPGR